MRLRRRDWSGKHGRGFVQRGQTNQQTIASRNANAVPIALRAMPCQRGLPMGHPRARYVPTSHSPGTHHGAFVRASFLQRWYAKLHVAGAGWYGSVCCCVNVTDTTPLKEWKP